MQLLTEDAVVRCPHGAGVGIVPTQTLVRIGGRQVLVDDNPENRPITMCPNMTLSGIKPCNKSLRPERGYSTFIKIDGRAVVLDSLSGLTDGTPPASWKYLVVGPGQDFVSAPQ